MITSEDPILQDFCQGYHECALWSSTDQESDTPLDNVDANPSEECTERFMKDCQAFFEANKADLALALEIYSPAHAGHDFWLTRNGHGAGFWDGDLPKDLGERLTKAAHAFGEVYLYVDGDKIQHG